MAEVGGEQRERVDNPNRVRASSKVSGSSTSSPTEENGSIPTVAVEGYLGTAGKAGRISEHYVKLLDNNIWIYKKKTDLAPIKHVDLGDATQVLRKGGKGEFSVEFNDDRGSMKFKAFSEDDFKLWGGAMNAQIKQAKQGPPPKKVIDVMFLDGSKFPMTIDTASTTAEDLWWMVCETLRLPNEARECFFIWLLGSDMEMLLCNDDIVYEQITKWHRAEKRYSDQGLEGPPRVVFRTTPMLELKIERNLKDTKSVHLFYIQSVFYVLNGYYIVDLQQAITLAGFAAQARFGDYDAGKHGPGYISKYLHKFIPGWIMQREKQKPEMWEAAVAREHKKHIGKPLMIVELLYLQIVRGAPYYGSTFFSGLGINMEGIHVFKKNKYMNSYPWKEISHWEIDQEKFFYFQSSVLDSGGFYAQYLIETRRAPLIRDLINDIVFELKREKKVLNSIRKRQSSAFDLVRRAAGSISVGGTSMKQAAIQDLAKGTFSDGTKPVERPRAVSRKGKQPDDDSDSSVSPDDESDSR